jgi:flagellar assembly protein FliH
VLRAVRLLPDAVKIGIENETALPSDRKEEQISNGLPTAAKSALKGALNDSPKDSPKDSPPPKPNPLEELSGQMRDLRANLSAIESAKAQLTEKMKLTEAELVRSREDFARKEREMEAGLQAAKERARAEGREQGQAEGLESGYKNGLEKARREVEEQYRVRFANAAALVESFSARLEERFTDLAAMNQPRLLRLWQDMLKRMLRRELVLSLDSVLDVLSDILSLLSEKNQILVYVSPEDLSVLQESRMRGEFEEVLRGVKRLELKPDTSVDKGSCIVETDLGVYDARWRTQLEQVDTVIENLLQKLGKPPEPKLPARRVKRPEAAFGPAGEPEPEPAPEKPEESGQPGAAETPKKNIKGKSKKKKQENEQRAETA